MSATQAWPNVAEVLCQSKYNFGSYSIFGDDRFFVSPTCISKNNTFSRVFQQLFRVETTFFFLINAKVTHMLYLS